jgi:hypothetical protein
MADVPCIPASGLCPRRVAGSTARGLAIVTDYAGRPRTKMELTVGILRTDDAVSTVDEPAEAGLAGGPQTNGVRFARATLDFTLQAGVLIGLT